jgi:hypothetical protein
MTRWIKQTLSETEIQTRWDEKAKRFKHQQAVLESASNLCGVLSPELMILLSVQPRPSLPLDVISLIAEFLTHERVNGGARLDEDSLRALARMNRVSKVVHEITLPYLYKTTDYTETSEVLRSLTLGDPRGWSYTR